MEYDPTRMCELLVGLGDVEVLGIDDKEGAPLRVRIRRRGSRPPCGGCGGLLWSDGERPVALVDLPAFGRPVRLVWHKRRWRCPRGGCEAGSATEQAAEIAPARALLTARAARWATRQAGRGRPLKDVAAELGCVWHTVNSAVKRWGAALLDADTERISRVSALGLDEHLMMRRGRFRTKAWGSGIVDVGRGQLLDIVRARTAEAPTRWLLGRPRGWRAGIRWAVLGPLGPVPGRVQRRGAQSPTGRGPLPRRAVGQRRPRRRAPPGPEPDAGPPRPQRRPAVPGPQAARLSVGEHHRERTHPAAGPARRRRPLRRGPRRLARQGDPQSHLRHRRPPARHRNREPARRRPPGPRPARRDQPARAHHHHLENPDLQLARRPSHQRTHRGGHSLERVRGCRRCR